MKLTKIRIGNDTRPSQIRYICESSNLLSEAIKRYESLPLSYLFIESILATNALNEAGEGRFEALLQAGVAKLNAALTPGNASDLDSLLAFMAPSAGGSSAVNSLIQQAAKYQGNIVDNQDWWNKLFNVFGVQDDTIKSNIQNQVKQDIGLPTQTQQNQISDPLDDRSAMLTFAYEAMDSSGLEVKDTIEAPSEAEAQMMIREKGFYVTKIQEKDRKKKETKKTVPQADLLQQLKAERDSVTNYQSDIASQIAANRKQREGNRAELASLRQRIDQMRSQAGLPEAICNNIALQLLNEQRIQNLNIVCGHMFRKIANKAYGRHIVIPTLNEAGLGDRLRGAFNNARNAIANPEYTKRKLAGTKGVADNNHAAKLAVQALTDHLRAAFESKLQENGSTPDQVNKQLETWRKLNAAYSRGNNSPELIDALTLASNNMNEIAKLLKPVIQAKPVAPVADVSDLRYDEDLPRTNKDAPADTADQAPDPRRAKILYDFVDKKIRAARASFTTATESDFYQLAKSTGYKALKSYYKKNPKEAIRLGKDLIKKLDTAFSVISPSMGRDKDHVDFFRPATPEEPATEPATEPAIPHHDRWQSAPIDLEDVPERPFENKPTWGTKEAEEARQRKNKIIYNLSRLAGKPVDPAAPDFDLITTIDDISKGAPWSKLMNSPVARDLVLSKLRENFGGDGFSDDQLIRVLNTKRTYRSMMLRKIIDEEVRDTTAEEGSTYPTASDIGS